MTSKEIYDLLKINDTENMKCVLSYSDTLLLAHSVVRMDNEIQNLKKKVKTSKVNYSLPVVRRSRLFKLYRELNLSMEKIEKARGDEFGIAVKNDAFALEWQQTRMRLEILEAFLENRNPDWTNARYLSIAEALKRNSSYFA